MRLGAYGDLNFKNAFIAGLSICSGLVMESDLFFPQAFPDYLTPFTTNGFAVGGMVAVSCSRSRTKGIESMSKSRGETESRRWMMPI